MQALARLMKKPIKKKVVLTHVRNTTNHNVDVKLLQTHVDQLKEIMHLSPFTVNIEILSDLQMAIFNKMDLDHDGPTDVLSYQQWNIQPKEVPNPKKHPSFLGDIFLGIEFIKRASFLAERDINTELVRLIVHGLCHLTGYDHIEDADYDIMRAKEFYILKKWRLMNAKNLETNKILFTENSYEVAFKPADPNSVKNEEFYQFLAKKTAQKQKLRAMPPLSDNDVRELKEWETTRPIREEGMSKQDMDRKMLAQLGVELEGLGKSLFGEPVVTGLDPSLVSSKKLKKRVDKSLKGLDGEKAHEEGSGARLHEAEMLAKYVDELNSLNILGAQIPGFGDVGFKPKESFRKATKAMKKHLKNTEPRPTPVTADPIPKLKAIEVKEPKIVEPTVEEQFPDLPKSIQNALKRTLKKRAKPIKSKSRKLPKKEDEFDPILESMKNMKEE